MHSRFISQPACHIICIWLRAGAPCADKLEVNYALQPVGWCCTEALQHGPSLSGPPLALITGVPSSCCCCSHSGPAPAGQLFHYMGRTCISLAFLPPAFLPALIAVPQFLLSLEGIDGRRVTSGPVSSGLGLALDLVSHSLANFWLFLQTLVLWIMNG